MSSETLQQVRHPYFTRWNLPVDVSIVVFPWNTAFLLPLTFSIHMFHRFTKRKTNYGRLWTFRTRDSPFCYWQHFGRGLYSRKTSKQKIPTTTIRIRKATIKNRISSVFLHNHDKTMFTLTLFSHPYQELCLSTRSLLSTTTRRCRETIAFSRILNHATHRVKSPTINLFFFSISLYLSRRFGFSCSGTCLRSITPAR